MEDRRTISAAANFYISGGGGAGINMLVYLKVFEEWAWFVISITGLAIGLLYGLTNLNNYFFMYSKGLVTFGTTLLQIGTPYAMEEESKWSFKLLFISNSFLGLFLFNCFASILTAEMTVGTVTPKIITFDDIVKHKYKVFVAKGTSAESFFANSQEGTAVHKIYQESLSTRVIHWDNWYENTSSILEESDKNVFYGSFYFTPEQSRITVVREFQDYSSTHLGFALQLDSEFKPIFDNALAKVVESGLLDEIRRKWLNEKSSYDHRIFFGLNAYLSLGYENLFLPTMVLALGVAGGMAVLLCEHSTCKRPQSRLEKKSYTDSN